MGKSIRKHARRIVQVLWGFLSNGYVKGFLPGAPMIYQGPLKRFCVPGMNCYSCPGALGACPIGALQAALNERHRRFPSYILGYLLAIGVLVGRFICGWLCLFGLVQELLYKIPVPKLRIPEKLDDRASVSLVRDQKIASVPEDKISNSVILTVANELFQLIRIPRNKKVVSRSSDTESRMPAHRFT